MARETNSQSYEVSFRLRLHQQRGVHIHGLPAHLRAQHIPKLAAPEQRRNPVRVPLQQGHHLLRVLRGQIQVGDDVGIDDDHRRPCCFARVISASVSTGPLTRLRSSCAASASWAADSWTGISVLSRQWINSMGGLFQHLVEFLGNVLDGQGRHGYHLEGLRGCNLVALWLRAASEVNSP